MPDNKISTWCCHSNIPEKVPPFFYNSFHKNHATQNPSKIRIF